MMAPSWTHQTRLPGEIAAAACATGARVTRRTFMVTVPDAALGGVDAVERLPTTRRVATNDAAGVAELGQHAMMLYTPAIRGEE